jgi:hypothetical protein
MLVYAQGGKIGYSPTLGNVQILQTWMLPTYKDTIMRRINLFPFVNRVKEENFISYCLIPRIGL